MRFRSLLLATLGILVFAVAQAGQVPSTTVWDGVYTREQALRGKETYIVFCANCHADDLAGTNSGDSGAPPLKYDTFMRGSTVGALFTKIRKSMPQDAPGSLQDPLVIDLVAYLLEANGFPAGATTLEPGSADPIRIVPR
ncbi:MAG: cytochrome c [Vicinamibacterales bacterium]